MPRNVQTSSAALGGMTRPKVALRVAVAKPACADGGTGWQHWLTWRARRPTRSCLETLEFKVRTGRVRNNSPLSMGCVWSISMFRSLVLRRLHLEVVRAEAPPLLQRQLSCTPLRVYSWPRRATLHKISVHPCIVASPASSNRNANQCPANARGRQSTIPRRMVN